MSKKIKPTETQVKTEEMMFGVAEAVEVLVTKYLSKVATKLKPKEKLYTEAVEAYDAAVKVVKDAVDTAKYNHVSETLGITSRVTGVKIGVNETVEDSYIRVTLMLTDTDITGERYVPEFGKFRNLEMPAETHADLTTRANAIDEARKVVAEINDLRNVDVRRQFHAKVMEIRLVDAGLTDIFDDEDIIAILDI